MYLDDQLQAKQAIDKGQVKAALIIPPHFRWPVWINIPRIF